MEERQNRMRILNFGKLEESETVSMLALDPVTRKPIIRRIFMRGNIRSGAQKRQVFCQRVTEWTGWDQVGIGSFICLITELLVISTNNYAKSLF